MKQLLLIPETERRAVFNASRTHRYSLSIRWAVGGKVLNFIMLNPSTADEHVNDPTVERCQRRAQVMGFGMVVVTNLFAFRSTNPKALRTCDDPVGGQENDFWIQHWSATADMVICAWGMHGAQFERSNRVRKLLADQGVKPYCLGTCDNGECRHPLYIPYRLTPQPYSLEIA